jgi:glycosyltransferase involved in cell wall biosynthesis
MALEDSLVSVVIPVYNGERVIGRTLASVLAQTYHPIEVVVVDDGSSDRTGVIVEAVCVNNSRVRYFRIEKSGVAAARNFGINQTHGKLIAPLDADDLWCPEKIARQVRVMETAPAEVGLVYCWALEIDKDDFVIPSLDRLQQKGTAKGSVTGELAKGNFIETSSVPLIKRSCIEAVGGYDSTLQPQGAEDWKLYLALSEICEFAVIPEYLVGYRQVSGSLSRNIIAMDQSIELVARWIFDRHPEFQETVKRQTVYLASVFLAQRALDNDKFALALWFSVRGYWAYPRGLLRRPLRTFCARFLARMVGIRRGALRSRGWVRRVSFQDFQSQNSI